MSTQSIIDLNVEELSDKTDKFLINIGKSYLSYKKYMLGSMPNFRQAAILSRFKSILCEEDCIVEDYIDKSKQTLNKMLIDANIGKCKKC